MSLEAPHPTQQSSRPPGPCWGPFVRWKWAPPAVELVVDALRSLGRQVDGRDALDGQHAERGHHHRQQRLGRPAWQAASLASDLEEVGISLIEKIEGSRDRPRPALQRGAQDPEATRGSAAGGSRERSSQNQRSQGKNGVFGHVLEFLSLQRLQHKKVVTPPEVRRGPPVRVRYKNLFMLPCCLQKI